MEPKNTGMPRFTPRLRALLLLIPLLNLVFAGFIAYRAYEYSQDRSVTFFNDRAETATTAFAEQMNDYQDLLYSGRAYVASSDQVTQKEWDRFFRNQAIFQRYKGISSIVFVESVQKSQLAEFEQRQKQADFFGSDYSVPKPQSDRPLGLISLYSSDNDISKTLATDVFEDEARRNAYYSAAAKGKVIASPPLRFATGYDGFILVLPQNIGGVTTGFLVASFRFDDLSQALLSSTENRLSYRITDITERNEQPIYTSAGWQRDSDIYARLVEVGGRSWRVQIADKETPHHYGNFLLPAVVVAAALAIVATTSVVLRHEKRYRSQDS